MLIGSKWLLDYNDHLIMVDIHSENLVQSTIMEIVISYQLQGQPDISKNKSKNNYRIRN